MDDYRLKIIALALIIDVCAHELAHKATQPHTEIERQGSPHSTFSSRTIIVTTSSDSIRITPPFGRT